MEERKKLIDAYFKYLMTADLNAVLTLFEKNALIKSPMYGSTNVECFYATLFCDTDKSDITVLNIYQGVKNNREWAALIHYDWQMRNGVNYDFLCVDVFRFSASLHISELTIIYDTFLLRENPALNISVATERGINYER